MYDLVDAKTTDCRDELSAGVRVDPGEGLVGTAEMNERLSGIFSTLTSNGVASQHACPNIEDDQLIHGTIYPSQGRTVGIDVICCDKISEACHLLPKAEQSSVLTVLRLGSETLWAMIVLWLVSA